MMVAKMVFAKVVAESVAVPGPPLAEHLRAVAMTEQKRAVLDALELLAPARERSD
jgi:hypothetical protein